jgi:hypothetical protein
MILYWATEVGDLIDNLLPGGDLKIKLPEYANGTRAEDFRPIPFLRDCFKSVTKETILEMFGCKNPSVCFYVTETWRIIQMLTWQLPVTTALPALLLYIIGYMAKAPKAVAITAAAAFLVFTATRLGQFFLLDMFIILALAKVAPWMMTKLRELSSKPCLIGD